MIKLTIGIYGTEAQREWLTFTINQVQAQLNKANRQDIDALYYVDKGEMNDEGKKKWLIDNSNGEYYTFIGYNFKIEKNYLASKLAVIDKKDVDVSIHELMFSDIFKRTQITQFI